jgi:spore germination protein GerM
MSPVSLARVAAVLIAFLLLIVGAIALWSDSPMTLSRPAVRRASEPTRPRSDGTRKTVMLFFLAQGQPILQEEPREIGGGVTTTEDAKRTLEELVTGPESEMKATMPPAAKIHNLFVDSSGTAYVDFNRELREALSGGAQEELSAVFSIVDTLTFNFPQIKRVQILIEGGEVSTLRGSVNTRAPLAPRYAF